MTTRCFPLCKGATRLPTVGSVPLVPLVVVVTAIACLAMLVALWWLALLLPAWLLMRQVTHADDRAFHVLGLWARHAAEYTVCASCFGLVSGR